MIVLTNGYNVYTPKLTIRACLIIDKLYGSITKPIESSIPPLDTQVRLLSLALQQYNLTEDELYDLFDTVEDSYSLILGLYEESGLINQEQQQKPVQSDSEPVEGRSEQSVPESFEQYMMELLEQCMSIGMSEIEFMDSTLNQVLRYVKSYQEKQKRELEQQAYMDWQLANLIGLSVARLLSKDAKYPELEKAYPFIGQSSESKEVDEEWELELQRIKLAEWAEQMNKKFAKEDEVE